MLETLQKLISIPSYSTEEIEIQSYIKKHLEGSGIQPFLQGHNLIVHLKGADQTRAFIFNGHVDVVDTGDIGNWKHDPWKGEIIDGKIFGRGASDMKGGIVSMMEIAKSLAKKDPLPTDVWFTFVVEEELDGAGTKQFAEWFKSEGYLAGYQEMSAVFAEPTNLDVVEHGHRGNFFIKAEKTGLAGHSGRLSAIDPNAILEMSTFINELTAENMVWGQKFSGSEFSAPTITPTSIVCNSNSHNKTPDHCSANFDLRTIPGYHQEAYDRVSELAKKRGIKLSLLHSAPTGYTKPDAKIVKVLKKIVPGIKITVNDASNDLGFFSQVNIDGVMFGPGNMNQAHTTDEYADVKKILSAPSIFEEIYFEWAKIDHIIGS